MDFLNNPKNRPFVIIGALVVLAIAGFAVFKLANPGGGPPSASVTPPSTGGSNMPSNVTPPSTGATAPPSATPAPSATGDVGASSTAATGAPGETPQVALARPLPSRSDPFQRVEGYKPITRMSLPRVHVVRASQADVQATQQGDRQVPTTEKRMAGIIWDGGIAAILVDEGRSYVVRPGDVIDNMKVVAIRRNSMTLRIGTDRVEEVFLRPSSPSRRTTGTGAGSPGAGGPSSGPSGGRTPMMPPRGGGGAGMGTMG